MSESQQWIERILTFIAGGGVLKIGDFFLNKKKAENDDFKILKEAYREEFNRYEAKFDVLNQKYAVLENKLADLRLENDRLRTSLKNVETTYPDLPVPMWLKDQNGMMLSLNKAYEDAFLFPQNKSRLDYIGHHDEDIWGEEIAELFRANDVAAASEKKLSFVIEDTLSNQLLKDWEFFKYPKYVDGIFIGVGGLALPKHDKKILNVKRSI